MKNKKLKLGDLKVQSFVTAFQEKEKNTVNGAAGSDGCSDYEKACPVQNTGNQCTYQGCPTNWCATAWGWWCGIV